MPHSPAPTVPARPPTDLPMILLKALEVLSSSHPETCWDGWGDCLCDHAKAARGVKRAIDSLGYSFEHFIAHGKAEKLYPQEAHHG